VRVGTREGEWEKMEAGRKGREGTGKRGGTGGEQEGNRMGRKGRE